MTKERKRCRCLSYDGRGSEAAQLVVVARAGSGFQLPSSLRDVALARPGSSTGIGLSFRHSGRGQTGLTTRHEQSQAFIP